MGRNKAVPIRRRLKRLKAQLLLKLIQFVARHPRLSDLYFCFDRSFQREHRAVLSGKAAHLQQLEKIDGSGSRYALRRNVHRLEKGLIMRPRRDVFARDYIIQTVDAFAASIASVNRAAVSNGSTPDADGEGESTRLLNTWAGDVLKQYFEATGSDDVIDRARRKWEQVTNLISDETVPCSDFNVPFKAPYKRNEAPLAVNYEAMLELARRRRSVRWYLPKPVPRNIIDDALRVALYSPSACNRQPFEFRIFDDPGLAAQIGAIPLGTGGFSENFPCLAVLVGQMDAFPFEKDRHVIYIDASLAAMAFQFALEVQGIGSCCINWPDMVKQEQQMALALGLRPDERVVMLISLGYPDPEGMVPYSQKKPLDEICSYNQTGKEFRKRVVSTPDQTVVAPHTDNSANADTVHRIESANAVETAAASLNAEENAKFSEALPK